MKKHQTYLVLLLAVLFSGTLNAKVNNYVGAYAFLGEWTLRPVQSDYKPSLGVAGGAGFMYELQAGKAHRSARFLFDIGVGAWGGMTSYGQSSNMTEPLLDQKDLQGDSFDYIYEVKNRHDAYRNVSIQVPIMLGFHYSKFYMMAGVKINTAIFTRTLTTADITTYGRYQNIPELHGMPDYQFFDNAKLNGSAKTNFNLDLNVSLEIGGRLGLVTNASGFDVPKRKIECRLAGFVDYGLTDIHTGGTKNGLVLPAKYDTDPASPNYVYKTTSMIDPNNLQVSDIMSTNGFAKAVNNLMVGVKFTILFQLPEEKKCVLCQDAYRSSARQGSGGVKYEE